MDRHCANVHTFSAPAPARPLPPPAFAEGEAEKTMLHLRPRARIARPVTWEDIVADRAARGLRTLDEPLPALVAPRSSSPTRGPSPSRGPKRERAVWEKFTWGANPFGEWERERRVGKAVKSMADLLSRPEWKGASVVGEAPDPYIARKRADAMRADARADALEAEAAAIPQQAPAVGAAAYGRKMDATILRRDAASARADATRYRASADECEKRGAVFVLIRHPSGATVTIDPSKVA